MKDNDGGICLGRCHEVDPAGEGSLPLIAVVGVLTLGVGVLLVLVVAVVLPVYLPHPRPVRLLPV